MEHTYTIDPFDLERLEQEIGNSEITIAISNISSLGDQVTILFKATLSVDEVAILDTLIANHTGEPIIVIEPPVEVVVSQSNYRLMDIDDDQICPKAIWTSIYSYEGSGYLWSFWVDLNSNNMDIELEVDSLDLIIPARNLDSVSGFGGSGQASMMPLVQLGTSNFAFTPQEKIKFNSKIEIKMKTGDSASGEKKVLDGYVSLVRES